ncbi:MAG: hypothetical protein ACYCYF_13590 [Anaerolineae bacterium]
MRKQLERHEEEQLLHRRSYLLRLWCAGEPGTGNWQASLEDPFTGERVGFSSLEQMFAFLMELSERETGGIRWARDSGS